MEHRTYIEKIYTGGTIFKCDSCEWVALVRQGGQRGGVLRFLHLELGEEEVNHSFMDARLNIKIEVRQ